MTHLVLGGPAAHPSAPRRTVKVLLGIAAGAHLLQPAWVTDSLAAGRWLPEAPYRAQVGGVSNVPAPVVPLVACTALR